MKIGKKLEKEEKRIKREWKNIIFNLMFAILTLLIPILFYRKILLTTALLFILTTISLVKWKSNLTLMIFIFGAIGGGLAEMIAIYFGLWGYSITNFYNVPFWLFIVWGNAAAFLYQTAIEFKKLKFARK